jgi:hypothetical protein
MLTGWLRALGDTAAARERALLRWNVKLLDSELARQRYAAGHAGPDAPLPTAAVAIGVTGRVCRQAGHRGWLAAALVPPPAHGAALSPEGVAGRLRAAGPVGARRAAGGR